jgi:hypothetical protein
LSQGQVRSWQADARMRQGNREHHFDSDPRYML